MDANDEIVLYDHLREKFIADGDQRWRKIDDCIDITEGIEDKQSDHETKFAVLETKVNWLIAIMAAVAVEILPVVVKYLFGGD